MRARVLLGAAAAVLASSAALAQPAPPSGEPRDRSVYFSANAMQAIEDGAKDKTSGAPAAFSKRLISASTHSTSLIRLLKPDTPHAHADWSEIFVVRAGSGLLETGGTITGVTGHDSATHKDMFLDPQVPAAAGPKRMGNPKDLAGTGIDGGVQQQVKAGDIVLVPAGVAHRWLKIDEPVIYLDIKFPKAG
ncbi:cupin domain-containing protein [Novosphingobium rosa]|uniref:cupin domain-containing protein n=1 Tax=Novosphingobium rosa TaxID=76978 RepID=UPI00082DA9CE|nr:cupin domain-containing protein [Novosphingobium rosa]